MHFDTLAHRVAMSYTPSRTSLLCAAAADDEDGVAFSNVIPMTFIVRS